MKSKNYLGYTVFSDGRIKSNGIRKVFLKGYDTGRGYDCVKLNGKNIYRHKVISECFLGERPINYTVNHIDGNKLNNNVSNLEYISMSDNYNHALRNNLKKNLGYYITIDEASDLIELYYNSNLSMQKLAEIIGFKDKGVISRLINGNYSYKFKDESEDFKRK